jgi:hypothetical protein
MTKVLIFSLLRKDGMHERGSIMNDKSLNVNQIVTAVGVDEEE